MHANSLKQLFLWLHLWKIYLAVHFTKAQFYQSAFTKELWFNTKVLPACWKYKPGFYFFSLYKIKVSKRYRFTLLHIALMSTISKVFTIFCQLCLCWNREYPGSFQNKSISSSFKRVSKHILWLAKLKGDGRTFWKVHAQIYPLNCLLHVEVMSTIYYKSVHHPIPTLSVGIRNTLAILKLTPLYFFSSNIIYFVQKEPIEVQIFETFECSGQNSLNSSCLFWSDKSILFKFCTIFHCHDT